MNGRDQPSSAEHLFAQYLALRDSDEAVPFDRFVAEHAEFQSELRRLAEGWETFEDVFDGALSKASTLFFRRGSPDERRRRSERLGAAGLRPGATVGEFELIRMLAEGGMGQVWEARQPALDRKVALKFIRPDCTDPDAIFLFEREARAGGRLQHPGAVGVYATGESQGVRWIAQELVEGGYTLDDFLTDVRREATLPPRYFEEVARFFLEIAEVLQAAHDAGVIHRDVKPGNVLVSPDDRPKLTDFGLARLMDDDRRSDPLALRGTPHYMSPEQVNGSPVGPRSDVFSFGSVLYEVLTRRRAFDGKTRSEIFQAILRCDPAAPRAVEPRVPRDLAVICAKALAPFPDERYPTMQALADDLRRFLAREPILARPAGRLQRARLWVRRHPGTSLAVGLGGPLAATVVLLGMVWASSLGQDRAFRRDAEILRASIAIEAGDLEGAERHARRAMAADPGDPRPHLALARGHARFARLDKAEAEVRRAVELGFEADPDELESASDHYEYALYVLAGEQSGGFAEAERHLERAAELDPELRGVDYLLYTVRAGLGDAEGALAAVERLRGRIGQDEDVYPVVDALARELDGDVRGAIAGLERVLAEHADDPELLAALHVRRNLGRCYLRAGELEEAERHLRAATRSFPEDDSSWLNLAEIELRRLALDPEAPDRPRRLEEARDLAERGRTWDPERPSSLRVEAVLAVESFDLDFDRSAPPAESEWAAVRDAVERLRGVAPGDPYLPVLDAHLEFLRGALLPTAAGRREAYARCLDANPLHVPARLALAQGRWFEGDLEGALDELEGARVAWTESEATPTQDLPPIRWRRNYLFAVHAWTFGTAALLGDAAAAREAREACERELSAGLVPAPEELITYAEFLGTAEGDLRDCARARELLEEHDPASALGAAAEPILAAIDASCP